MSNVTRRKKTLTRDSDPKSLPVYDCEYFSDEDVKENLGRIKLIKNFQEMFNEITRTIHSLPDLFKDDLELQHVKIYLGRTGYLENTGNRHFDNLNLPYIVPVIRVKTENVKAFEKWGILLIQKIQQNEVLCCGHCLNISGGSPGRLPNTEESLIYIAFGFDKKYKSNIANKDFARKFASWLEIEGLYDEENYNQDIGSLEEALETISKPSSKKKLFWHTNSRED